MTVQITNATTGDELSYNLAGTSFTNADVFVGPNATSLTFRGPKPASEFTKVLRSIGFLNVSQNPYDNYTRNIAFEANDGTDFSRPVSATAQVIAVNNAPSVSVPFAQPIAQPEDVVLTVPNLVYVDPDDTPPYQATPNIETLDIRISDPNGALHANVNLPVTTGITFISGGNNTPAMTIRGTKANLNAALAALQVRAFRYFNGDLILTLTPSDTNVNDPTKGNYGTPGVTPVADQPQTGTPATVQITFTPVNNAPVIHYAGPNPLQSNWNTTVAFTGANTISMSDPDIGTNPGTEIAKVDLQVSAGTLSMDPNTFGGLNFSIGNGINNNVMEFRGVAPDAINAALATLVYTPPTNFVGRADLDMTVDDQGFFGAGG